LRICFEKKRNLKENCKCRPSCIFVGEPLRSKLNCAGKATGKNLAASKTALGLHSGFTFPENLLAGNENVFTVFTFSVSYVKKL
jgi:hypothetical protein